MNAPEPAPRQRTSGGVELTDEVMDLLAEQAEDGYDAAQLRPRGSRALRDDAAQAQECVELKWMQADPDFLLAEPGTGPLMEWYRSQGLNY